MKNLFNFNKREEKASKGSELLRVMKDSIMEFVEIGKKDRKEVKNHSVVFMTDCSEGNMNPTFSCVGTAESLIKMIYAGALEDEEFGKILVTATQAAIFRSPLLKELQNDLLESEKDVQAIKSQGKSLKLDLNDLKNMSPEEVVALAKKLAKERNDE